MASIADPNSVSWMPARSASLAAQAYISSSVFGVCVLRIGPALSRAHTPADQLRHADDRVGAVFLAEMGHQLHRVAVEDHRLLTGLPDVGRHHFGVDGRKSVQAKLFGDLGCGGELHRSRDLVAESVDEFDRRCHATA